MGTIADPFALEVTPDVREGVRWVIEALRLGEAFDEYRTCIADGDAATEAPAARRERWQSAHMLAETIADAFVDAAGWEDE